MRYFTALLAASKAPASERKASEHNKALAKGKGTTPSAQKARGATQSVSNVPYVFVGNLSPVVTSQDLHALFKDCGKSFPITIRCSSGSAVIFDPTRSKLEHFEDSTYYAPVQFYKLHSIRKALNLNGQMLGGRRIVVALDASDLPETQDIAQGYRDPSKLRKPRPLKREDTVIIDLEENRVDPMQKAYSDLQAGLAA